MARGARATEERLLEVLERRQAEAKSDLSLLSRPVLVVVSSGTLRKHLAAAIVARLGPSVLGVEVKKLWSLAGEVLERAGKRPVAIRPLFEVLVRREAAKEAVLRTSLEELDDGYRIVATTVRDLLNACYEPGGRKKLERILSGFPEVAARARALAILRVAARTAEAMVGAGVGRIGDLLREAAVCLEERGPELIPAREILIHGFSDAPGRTTEFIRALIRHAGARILLDEPPDPTSPAQADLGASFMRRFALRLLGEEIQEPEPAQFEPSQIRFFDASGADAEAREVAYRVRALLDGGARPESVAVVARTLHAYAVPIRRHFEALAIPFSADRGLAPAGLFPAGRRIEAAMEVLRRGGSVPVDQWFDALDFGRFCKRVLPDSRPSRALLGDLRLALRTLGVARINDLQKLSPEKILKGKDFFTLPVRCGFQEMRSEGSGEASDDLEADAAESVEVRARRRKLDGKVLEEVIGRANELIKFEKKWSDTDEAGLSTHVGKIEELLKDQLFWDLAKDKESTRGFVKEVNQALENIKSVAPGGMALRWDEVLLLLRNELDGVGTEPLGGSGAGVQVLDVAHARGLTFDHLFLVGVNRGVFPRRIQEDPLLPDDIRRRLQTGLPHLLLKGAGFDEERYLFADLISATLEVCISWQRTDEEGRALNPSPLVERLRIAPSREEVKKVPRIRTSALAPPFAGGSNRPRPARDALVFAALAGSRRRFGEILPLALEESAERFGGEVLRREPEAAAAELAQARLRILDEQDPDRRTPDGRELHRLPSPYFGLVGVETGRADPRKGELYVTTLERMAACPWQTFLTRILRLEPVPDPMAALPGLGPMHVGIVVHQTLQLLVKEVLGRRVQDPDESTQPDPVPMTRPDPDRVEELIARSAFQVARDEGIHLAGLQRALADLTRPYVKRALEIDWPEADTEVMVLGAEVVGEARIPLEGSERIIHFRADRVDRAAKKGSLTLTDYKTGKPISNAKTQTTRDKHFRAKVEVGTHLQAAAYAASREDPPARGRYLFLNPDLEDDLVEAVLDHEHEAVKTIFPATAGALLGAWEAGVFYPRVEDPDGKEPNVCKWCDVAEACLRSDSGARRRLREIVGRAEEALRAGRDVPRDLERLVRVWRLGRKDRVAPAGRAGREEGGG